MQGVIYARHLSALERVSTKSLSTHNPAENTQGWELKKGMHHQAKEEGDPPKLQGEEEGDSNPTGSSGTQSTPSPPSPETTMEGETQLEEEGTPALTPYPNSRHGGSCRPGCLLVALILMLISLLGSWAVVHLTLGSRGTTPFRIQASYDQPIEQDATATIEPGFTTTIEPGFTTNCTVGK